MSEYLSKEEIKQWRSSLERITLEEYAQRLGKLIKEEKRAQVVVVVVVKNEISNPKVTTRIIGDLNKKDKIVTIARKAVETEKKIINKGNGNIQALKDKLAYRKPLTEREETVLDVFLENSNEVVYAKELAKILNLPNDYIYKYIKNLRTKIHQNILENVNGGYKINID
jgi:DNA-binding CsgD family transcriptional regulator